jgi:hypothetical protein
VTAIRNFSTLALMAALVVPACAPDTDKQEVVEDFSQLTSGAQTRDAFSYQMQIVGSLDYGQSSSAVSYRNPPRFRAFKFAGDAGDHVIVDVRSTNGGDAVAWLLDDSFHVVAANDDAADGVYDSRIEVTLPEHASRTHYVVFRDYSLKSRKFKVQLTGTSGISYCNQDSDCEKITAGCCQLSYTAIAAGKETAYRESLACPADLVCSKMMIRFTDDVAQCDNDTHRCELVDPLAVSCGGRRVNVHECPEGYLCQGAGLKVDAPGTCRKFCGGIGNIQCADGASCVDDPTDECDPATGGADCGGICQPRTCGGFGNLACPDSLDCIDDPNDSCDVATGGADCGGLCSTH